MDETIKIRKYSGELVEFDVNKLIASLKHAKADDILIEEITKEVVGQLYDGISSKKIYQMAFKILKKKTNTCASRYKLKKAIIELGPSGFPFERFIGAILEQEGYKTEVGVVLQGHCITHEVDVVAINHVNHYMVECKFHNRQGRVNDIKIPLYIQSRFLDLKQHCIEENDHKNLFHQGWIYTNTRFSSDAIQYGNCVGLKLVSWDYPPNDGLMCKINKSGLFPLTALTVITKKEKEKILDQGIVLCKEIYENPEILVKAGIPKSKHKKIIANAKDLVQNGSKTLN